VFAVIHPVAALYCPTCPAHQSSAVCSHSARYSDCYFRPVRLCFTRRLSFRLSVGNFTEKKLSGLHENFAKTSLNNESKI